MSRLLPHPLLALALLVMWLLLTQSISPGQIALGAIAGFLGAHALHALRPEPVGFKRLGTAARLSAIVIADIVHSNLAVAALVLRPRRDRVAGFVRLPLELGNRNGLAILALIITATPGTIWVELDRARSILLVHVLDLVDEEQWVALIKRRYEAPLLEIFES